VKAGGPAEGAGIRVDDKIKSVDGKTVADLTVMQAANFLSSGQIGIGEVVQLGIDRGAQPVTVTITSIKW
jgi:C-terminal processing protease CtpA/Prc